MHKEILGTQTAYGLEHLAPLKELSPFYLAGGTGLALQLGHRRSLDLDFFSPKEFSPDRLVTILGRHGKFSLEGKEQGTLHGIFEGAKISFLYYPYKLLFPCTRFNGLKVADTRDIGCMKLDAASSRGTRKDFIDLWFLLKEISLSEMLTLFEKKYKHVDYNLGHVLKSLVYFKDAAQEPDPVMLKPYSWKKLVHDLEQKVKEVSKV